MNPTIAIQIIARSILWSFVFSFEIVANDVLKKIPPTYLYYVATIVMTTILFIATLRFSDSALVRDIRELCFYDVLVQCLGLTIHFTTLPASIFWALCSIVMILKFGRLLWMAKNLDKNTFTSWPVFGLVGLYAKGQGYGEQSGASKQQDAFAYAFMAAIIAGTSLVYIAGLEMAPMSFWALIAVCLIAGFYKRIITYCGIAGADGYNGAANFNAFVPRLKQDGSAAKHVGGHRVGLESVAELCATIGTTMKLRSRVGTACNP